jgi:hypothetical protein
MSNYFNYLDANNRPKTDHINLHSFMFSLIHLAQGKCASYVYLHRRHLKRSCQSLISAAITNGLDIASTNAGDKEMIE